MYSRPSRHLLISSQQWKQQNNARNIFKDNNKDTRTTTGVFVVNVEDVLHIALLFPLLTLNKKMPAGLTSQSRHVKKNCYW